MKLSGQRGEMPHHAPSTVANATKISATRKSVRGVRGGSNTQKRTSAIGTFCEAQQLLRDSANFTASEWNLRPQVVLPPNPWSSQRVPAY